MQITIDFAQVSVPTSEPYEKNNPDRQRENVAYVALQLLAQAKQAGVKLTYTDNDEPPTFGLRLDGAALATQDTQWNGIILDLGMIQLRVTKNSAEVLSSL